MKGWYRIQAAARDNEPTTVFIYDEISSWGISANEFVRDLLTIKASEILLRINSPGGNVFDGIAIANALKSHPATISVQVDGLAASIASIIAMAGDTIHMASNAFLMIHKAWALEVGNADAMRKMADTLEMIDASMLRTYIERSGADEEQVRDMMGAETWLTADEAKDLGLCDTVGDVVAAAASFDLGKYGFKAVPESLRVGGPGRQPTARGIEAALRDAGVSKDAARAAVAAVKKVSGGSDPHAESRRIANELTNLMRAR